MIKAAVRGAARLHLHRQFARACCALPAAVSRLAQFRAHALAFLLELHALRLERRQCVDRGFHAATRGAQIRFAARQFHAHVGELGFKLLQAPRSIVGAGLRSTQFGAPIDMFAVQAVDFRLEALAPIFVVADTLSRVLQALFQFLELALERADLRANFPQAFFALDHAGVRIRIARYAQPVAAQPNSVASHHRFAGVKPRAAA